MKPSRRQSLADLAITVGDALYKAGIRAVLTGGACASLHSGGAYHSMDVDFVIIGPCTTEALDEALAPIGFSRDRDRYVHDDHDYFVEFPRGPLGIGGDTAIRPVWHTRRGARALALSATDSCRDRLTAFYHWNDRQALAAAIAIALRQRLNFAVIRRWSEAEGMLERYEVFRSELAGARKATRRSGAG